MIMAKKQASPKRRLKGEGSVRIRPDGTVELRKRINGVQKSFYGKDINEAKQRAEDFQNKLRLKNEVDNVYFEELILKWLRDVKHYELKPSSYDRLESTINNKIIPAIY